MVSRRPMRMFESPLLLVFLLLTATGLAVAYRSVDAESAAPDIPGYDWSRHANVLLLTEPTNACNSCGLPLSDWVLAGIAHKLDVVVVTQRPVAESRELLLLQKQLSPSRFFATTASQPQIFERFSPHDKTGAVLIRDGRIVHHAEGGMPDESFWNLSQKEVKQ
ncbi:MAG: hypothetical protein JWN98_1713 [Abditibacteriota bacterium]|nr:hypothetical protein [Abditibacteriota bacterium]